jgi:hypothetical protein
MEIEVHLGNANSGRVYMASGQTAALELCEPWVFPRPVYRGNLDDPLKWHGIRASSVRVVLAVSGRLTWCGRNRSLGKVTPDSFCNFRQVGVRQTKIWLVAPLFTKETVFELNMHWARDLVLIWIGISVSSNVHCFLDRTPASCLVEYPLLGCNASPPSNLNCKGDLNLLLRFAYHLRSS